MGAVRSILNVPPGQPVRELAIATTDKCQARCAHCLMKSGPERSEVLTVEQMWDMVSYLKTNHGLGLVVFTGGESTLLGDDLFEIIARCSVAGLGTRLVSNAIWADTEKSAESMTRSLRECGLGEVNYSTDDFHQVWVSLANIRNAWRASKGKGFQSVVIGLCSGPRSRITPDYIQDFLEEEIPLIYDIYGNPVLPGKSNDGTLYAISNTAVSRLGRGKNLRPDYLNPASRDIRGGCGGVLNPLTLMADGSVGFCCGINSENNLILSVTDDGSGNFSARAGITPEHQKLILRAIKDLGPAELYGISSGKPLVEIEARYHSMCEVCEHLTTSDALIRGLTGSADLIKSRLVARNLVKRMATCEKNVD